MQPIAEWLTKIGLERYVPAFAENDIDLSVLPLLIDADLERSRCPARVGEDVGGHWGTISSSSPVLGQTADGNPGLAEAWRKIGQQLCDRWFGPRHQRGQPPYFGGICSNGSLVYRALSI